MSQDFYPFDSDSHEHELTYWRDKAQMWRRKCTDMHKSNAALVDLLHQSIRSQSKYAARVWEIEQELLDLRPPF